VGTFREPEASAFHIAALLSLQQGLMSVASCVAQSGVAGEGSRSTLQLLAARTRGLILAYSSWPRYFERFGVEAVGVSVFANLLVVPGPPADESLSPVDAATARDSPPFGGYLVAGCLFCLRLLKTSVLAKRSLKEDRAAREPRFGNYRPHRFESVDDQNTASSMF
jgi:hypothetical protein